MVTYPYNTTDFCFTLENFFIQFATENDSYFTLQIDIKYYEFYSETEKTKTLNYKIPVFNGAASLYVGNIIHRNLANLITNFTEGFQTKISLVTFTAVEIDISDGTTVATTTLTDAKFIPGKRPKKISSNIALLNINSNYCRITPNGHFQTSFLLAPGEHVLKTYKNTSLVNTLNITATTLDAVYSTVFSASDYEAKRGDVFKLEVDTTTIYKEVGVIPETTLSHQLLYIGFNKLLNSLECTGDYYFPDQYNQITQKRNQSEEEVLDVIETITENFIKINTGWILKDQVGLIDEIYNSKKVFINNIEGSNLEMVPTTKKRTGYDSTEELYSYDLEFRINKKTDA